MKIGKMFLGTALIFFSAACGFLIGRQNDVSVSAQKKPKATAKIELLNKIKAERIKEIKVLETDESKFYAVIRETDEPVSKDSALETSEKLIIYDETGKAVFEHRDFGVYSLKTVSFKPKSRQIMIETNGGGTDNFLKIIEYQNGRFNDLINESEMQLRGGYFVIPQYRTDNKTPYFNPAQLIVIQQIGGADENPPASVFRTKDNKFQKAGEIKMQELGDFIENQIVKYKTAK